MTDSPLRQRSLSGDQVRAALGGSHILTDGNPPGIIACNPMQLQCAACGAIATQPQERRWQTFMTTSGYGFHACTRGSEGRLCRACWDQVRFACPQSRCKT